MTDGCFKFNTMNLMQLLAISSSKNCRFLTVSSIKVMSPPSPLKSCLLQTMQMLLAEKTGAGVPTCHTKETCLTCVAWRLGCVMPELGSILWQPYTQVCQKASHNACGGPVNTWCLFLVLLFTFKSDLMWKIIASVMRVKL